LSKKGDPILGLMYGILYLRRRSPNSSRGEGRKGDACCILTKTALNVKEKPTLFEIWEEAAIIYKNEGLKRG